MQSENNCLSVHFSQESLVRDKVKDLVQGIDAQSKKRSSFFSMCPKLHFMNNVYCRALETISYPYLGSRLNCKTLQTFQKWLNLFFFFFQLAEPNLCSAYPRTQSSQWQDCVTRILSTEPKPVGAFESSGRWDPRLLGQKAGDSSQGRGGEKLDTASCWLGGWCWWGGCSFSWKAAT